MYFCILLIQGENVLKTCFWAAASRLRNPVIASFWMHASSTISDTSYLSLEKSQALRRANGRELTI